MLWIIKTYYGEKSLGTMSSGTKITNYLAELEAINSSDYFGDKYIELILILNENAVWFEITYRCLIKIILF